MDNNALITELLKYMNPQDIPKNPNSLVHISNASIS